MPFYAGWGLTHDRQQCERRTNKRSLEELFYITYIMYSFYVNPDTGKQCEIEEAMEWLLKERNIYFKN
jgi:capsular polysaccharide export protein